MFTCVTQVSSHVWTAPSKRIDMAHYAKAATFQTSSHSFRDFEGDQSRIIVKKMQILKGIHHTNENQGHIHSFTDLEGVIGDL